MISPYVYPGIATTEEVSNNQMLNLISEYLKVSIDEIKSNVRKREYVTARKWYAFIQHLFKQQPFKSIGKDLGGKDHSTQIHAMQKLKSELQAYPNERAEFRSFICSIDYRWGAIFDNYLNSK